MVFTAQKWNWPNFSFCPAILLLPPSFMRFVFSGVTQAANHQGPESLSFTSYAALLRLETEKSAMHALKVWAGQFASIW